MLLTSSTSARRRGRRACRRRRYSAPTASAAASASRSSAASRLDGDGLAALLDVGDPGRRRAASSRRRPGRAETNSRKSRKSVALDRLKALQIIDARDLVGRRQVVRPRGSAAGPCPARRTAASAPAARARCFAPRRASRAASRDSSVQVGGVGRPARASRNSSSTCRRSARSRARRSRRATPSASSACSTPSRLVIASNEPAGHGAHMHGVGQSAPKPGSASPLGLAVSKPQAARSSRTTSRARARARPPPCCRACQSR